MTATAIVVLVICAFLLLRVGVRAKYDADGLRVRAKIAFVRFTVYPRKGSVDAPQTAAEKRAPREKSERRMSIGNALKLFRAVVKEPVDETAPTEGGEPKDFRKIVADVLRILASLKRKLLVKRLDVLFVQGGSDAFTMAMTHGVFGMVFGATQGVLEEFFHVKRYSLRTATDFLAPSSRVTADVEITLAIWEVIALTISAILFMLRLKKPAKTKTTVKTAAKGEA